MTRIEEKKLVNDVIGSYYMSSHNGDIREGPLVQKMLESALRERTRNNYQQPRTKKGGKCLMFIGYPKQQ